MIALQISHTVQTSTEHCSIASHCLALSYWRCSWRFIIGTFPKWPISIVMDAWFYCAKRALSHSSKLLSRAGWWAVLILSPLTFSPFLASFKWKPQWASSSKEAISPGTNVFYYLLISLSMHFVASSIYLLVFMCALVSPCIECVDTDEFTSICICACGGVQAEQKTAFCPWCCFHIVFLCSRCNIQLFRKHNYQSSQLLLANFKVLLTCCSFSFY